MSETTREYQFLTSSGTLHTWVPGEDLTPDLVLDVWHRLDSLHPGPIASVMGDAGAVAELCVMFHREELGHPWAFLSESERENPPPKNKGYAEMDRYHRDLCDDARELMRTKNLDYGAEDNLWQNFTATEALGLATTECGILIRMADKLSRLQSFAVRGELAVKGEGVRDALIDIVNYSALLGAYIERKANGHHSG